MTESKKDIIESIWDLLTDNVDEISVSELREIRKEVKYCL